jgi:2-dehydropantoate 2-reductase
VLNSGSTENGKARFRLVGEVKNTLIFPAHELHSSMADSMNPSIAILGLGAIGASIARALYLNRIPFTLLARDQGRLAELNRGFSFTTGRKRVEINSSSGVMKASLISSGETYDRIFLGMKSVHLPESVVAARKLLTPSGKLILLQNGIPLDLLPSASAAFCKDGIVGYNVQIKDGSYYQSNAGHLILGEDGRMPDKDLKLALEPHLPVILTDNAKGFRWNKLAINCVINGLGAISGEPLGPIFGNKHGRELAIQLLEETGSVIKAMGVHEEIVPGGISVFKFGRGGWPRIVQHSVLRALGLKYRQIKTSMLQDIENHRPTEVRSIHGAVLDAARKVNVAVPRMKAVVETIGYIEKGEMSPYPGLLSELAKA